MTSGGRPMSAYSSTSRRWAGVDDGEHSYDPIRGSEGNAAGAGAGGAGEGRGGSAGNRPRRAAGGLAGGGRVSRIWEGDFGGPFVYAHMGGPGAHYD